jgi:hypothetical protein
MRHEEVEEWPIGRLRDEQLRHDPDRCEAYRHAIRRNKGKPFPVLVAPDGLILDGHHRARANKLEGITTIPVIVAGAGVVQQFAEGVKARSLRSRKTAAARWTRDEF